MKKIIFSLMACAALCACSSDDIISDTASTASQDDVYMKFNLTMSSATRTATSDNMQTEEGQANENNVSSVLVMIVAADGTIAASSDVTLAGSGSEYVATFSSKDVALISGEANVYVYCNPTSTLAASTVFDADATYTLTDATDATPWTSNAMFMSSAKELTTNIPNDLSAYNSEANAYELGTVEVERSIARFDYKDGSQGGDYTYTVSDNDGNALATITLSEVALVNMSNSFYHLRRVADNNSGVADLTTTKLLGTETANNWVIDTDVTFKLNYNGGASTADNFAYILGAPSTWDFASLSDLTALDDGYGIWRYATENTIPSINQQKKGISTIVVFKGLIKPAEGGITLPTDGSRIYVYDGVLYGTWDDIATVIEDGEATTSLKTAYEVVMGVAEEEGGEFNEYDKTISQTMQDVGFTGYSPDDDGNYYTYYYYYNQHNEDASEATMGIMEYAVVRNNVYKLSVTDITGFGRPTPPVTDPTDPRYGDDPTPDPDPDPEDPNGSIIDTNTYFRVDVQILPWTQRVNDIEF